MRAQQAKHGAPRILACRHVSKAPSPRGDLDLHVYQREATSRAAIYDLAVAVAVGPSGASAVAVGQGFVLRVLDVATGRVTKTLQQDVSGGERGLCIKRLCFQR